MLIKSEKLKELSLSTLAILRMSNMIIIDKNDNLKVVDFVKKLNDKISEDITWKECSDIEIIEVDIDVFDRIEKFISGDEIVIDKTSRGNLLT